jgi:PAS domain S-box-containing protein
MDEVSIRIQALEAEISRLRSELNALRGTQGLNDPDQLLRTLMEQTPDHVYFKDLQSRFIRANRAVATSFRQGSAEDLVGKSDFDFFSQEHARQAYEDEQEIIRTGMPKVNLEEEEVWPDGRRTWVSTTKVPFRDAEGTVIGTFGISRDITYRKQAEEALRLHEEKLWMMFEHGVDGILFGSHEGVLTDANKTFCEMSGYSKEELVDRHVSQLFSEETLRMKPLRFDLGNKGERVITERDLLRKDGSSLPIEMHARMMPDQTYQAIMRDLSERKKNQVALREQEASYRELFDSVREAIYIQDQDGRFLEINRGAMEMYDRPREFFIGHTPEIIAAPGMNDLDHIATLVQRAFAGEPQSFEFWGVRSNGEVFPKEVRLYKGTYAGRDVVIAMAQDISERKKVELALQASERHYRELLDRLQEGFAFADIDERFVLTNPAAAAILGVTGNLVGHNFKEFLDPETLKEVERQTESRKKGDHGFYELPIRRPDGEVRILSLSVSPWLNDAGEYIGSSGLFQDITDRKMAEKALQASEQHFRELLERLQEGFAFLDVDDRYVFANPAASEIFGVPSDLVGRRLQDFLDEDSKELIARQTERRRKGEHDHYEHPIQRPSGERRILSVSVSPWMDEHGAYQGASCLFQDITERVKAELALRASEENFRTLLNKLGEGFAVVDTDEHWTYANPAAAHIFGVEPEQLIGHSIREYVDEATFQEIRHQTERRRLGESSAYEIQVRRASGELRHVALSASPFLGDNGEFLGADGLFLDVTERKRAEQALVESQKRYHELFTNTMDAIFWIRVEENGTFIVESVNPTEEAFIGKSSTELEGKRIQDIVPGPLAETILANYRRCIEAGRPIRYEEKAELATGTKTFQTLLVPIRDDRNHIVRLVGFAQDTTQAKQAEEALRQAQKLESLGVLAGGIAHDFNNLLTAILGNLNLAQMKSSPESPAQPYLENVERAILKAAELTKQMLAYSGKGRFVVQLHDLNHVVQEMTHLLNVSISKKVMLKYDLAKELPLIEADAAQIQQVVMNLVTNASEAIGDKEGVISIATRQQILDEAHIRSTFAGQHLSPGVFAALEISDTGSGISTEIMSRIFDPFFTTKQSGRGLGLSAMQGILRGHHAGIRISSRVNKGSTFSLFFPIASHGEIAKEALPSRKAKERLEGRVLLVDDETDVLEVTQAMLESLGLQVLTAVDGQDALERFQTERDLIDLVLLDLTMPRMDGRETFTALRRIRGDIPVILYSGYSEHDSLKETLGQGFAGFVQKPFQMAELRRAIHQALNHD